MAKIGSLRKEIPGVGYMDLTINYSRSHMFTLTGLQDSFINLTKFRTWGYSTEHDLLVSLDAAIYSARALLTTSKKVIAFIIYASTLLRMNKIKQGSYQGTLPGISNKIEDFSYRAPDCSVGIEYNVYMVVNDGLKNKYHQINDDGSLAGPSNIMESRYIIIDWTQEREDFFKSIYTAMSDMLLKMSKFFFDKDINELTANIDNKLLALK